MPSLVFLHQQGRGRRQGAFRVRVRVPPSYVLPGKRTSLSPTDEDAAPFLAEERGRKRKGGRKGRTTGKNYDERGRGKREVDEPGTVVLIIVSASIVPDRRLQVQPGTRSIPLPCDSYDVIRKDTLWRYVCACHARVHTFLGAKRPKSGLYTDGELRFPRQFLGQTIPPSALEELIARRQLIAIN